MASPIARAAPAACLGLLLAVAGCAHELSGPEPELSSGLDPHLICNELEPMTTVDVTGSGMSPMPVDTALEEPRLELPRLLLRRTADLDGVEVSAEPVGIPDGTPSTSQVRWHDQGHMSFDVTPDMALAEGIYELTVRNPNGNEGTRPAALAVVPPPELTAIEPDAICLDQGDVTITVQGSGYLVVDGVLPTVTVRSEGEERTYHAAGVDGCQTLPAPATDAETCTELTVVIPAGDLSPGEYEVVVTNPAPAACSSSETLVIEVVPPPELDAVVPARLCTTGGTIGLEGSGFQEGASVEVGGVAAETVVVDPGGESATATFGDGVPPGTQDVTIFNPGGCATTLEDAVEVIQGPVVFWVDPPVVYAAIATQITIYASGLSGELLSVELVPVDGGAPIPLDFVYDATHGRIQAVVPAGTPPGEYDVRVHDEECPAVLPGGLVVTETLALDITAVEPPFGWDATSSPVSIFGSGFVSTPRAYLNPQTPAPETVATTLGAVAFVDGSRLTAVVPAGLPTGVYDLIVVNPTGEVGLLEDAFTVTSAEPPTIDGVSPGEVDSGDVRDIDVVGSGFVGPDASWVCRERSGATSTPAGSVTTSTETTATVTLDATTLPAGTVCVLRLTNADGAYAEFSAVAITNPSSNIQPFLPGVDMVTARRGLGLVAGRATRAARFLYALGGDDGAEAGAYDSSESVSVDLFGEMGSWFEQPNGLPGPRTLLQAQVIGRLIYLVGGSDGGGAVAEVHRAEILDPLDAPIIVDIGVTATEAGAGLGSGIWYYRVSAVFPADHPTNPSGESLASDPLVVHLPDSLPIPLEITLYWSEVAGASSYRVYRSPEPSMASGSELLLAEVLATEPRELVDDATVVPSGPSPLPLGAHGTWVALPSLGTARAGHGLGHAVDPGDSTVHYLYAVGGVDGSGAALDSYELLAITVASDRDQTVAASWVAGAEALSLPRSELGLYSVDHGAAPRVPLGTTYLYAVAGLDGTGDAVSVAEVAVVTAGGQLGPFLLVDAARNRAGFALAAASNFLYIMGGGPTATTAALSAEICGAGLSCTGDPDDPPDVRNWNNEGAASLTPARYLPGSTLESAFIYVVGGVDATDAVLASTEQTVW